MTMPARRRTQSSALRSPMPEQTPEGANIYLNLVEARMIILTRENLRLRACLEAATGQAWDAVNTGGLTNEQIDEYVSQDISRGLNLSIEDARSLVQENKLTANPSQVEGEKSQS